MDFLSDCKRVSDISLERVMRFLRLPDRAKIKSRVHNTLYATLQGLCIQWAGLRAAAPVRPCLLSSTFTNIQQKALNHARGHLPPA